MFVIVSLRERCKAEVIGDMLAAARNTLQLGRMTWVD